MLKKQEESLNHMQLANLKACKTCRLVLEYDGLFRVHQTPSQRIPGTEERAPIKQGESLGISVGGGRNSEFMQILWRVQ